MNLCQPSLGSCYVQYWHSTSLLLLSNLVLSKIWDDINDKVPILYLKFGKVNNGIENNIRKYL